MPIRPSRSAPGSRPNGIDRRTFLAGLATAAMALGVTQYVTDNGVGTGVEAISEGGRAAHPAGVRAFDHIVVLMMENRSFDQLLGRLYRPDELRPGTSFAGLRSADFSNVAPDGTRIAAYRYQGSRDRVLTLPNTNAGEDLNHVNRQLFGKRAPFGRPEMDGFVLDYVENFRRIRGRDPVAAEYRQVMGGFGPNALPVISTLARSFGVFDHWFASVPSDTFCNRSFVHAATSHGFVTNAGAGGYAKWLNAPAVPTLFNRLHDAGKPWRVYYDETQAVSLTGILAAPSIEPYWLSNFRNMEQFHEDARTGRLPAYSFIEPRMIVNRNSMHPPTVAASPVWDGLHWYDKNVADMLAAEALIAEVYESIRQSASATGSNFENTTLIITFDESGGLYDHVPPPRAAPPDDGADPGEYGFTFDRLGCRVPAIVVSAWTDAGTIINDCVDHSSIIATVSAQHGLPPLTDRDAGARSLVGAATRSTPRSRTSWPVLVPYRVPAAPAKRPRKYSEPTSTGLGILGLVLARFQPFGPKPTTLADTFDTLADHGAALFGTRDTPFPPVRRLGVSEPIAPLPDSARSQ